MFILTDQTQPRTEWTNEPAGEVKWRTLAVPGAPRRALVVTSGHAACLDHISAEPGEELRLVFGKGLPKISNDGLDIVVLARNGESEVPLLRSHVSDAEPWREEWIAFPNLPFHGSLVIRCGPGPKRDPLADWLGLSEIAIGNRKELNPARARANRDVRAKNEKAHFSRSYRRPMFTTKVGQNAFGHALGIIQRGSVQNPLDFRSRARQMGTSRPLNVLSICSGAARVEEWLFAGLAQGPRLTLLDINEDLLAMAAERLRSFADVAVICGDANTIHLPERHYDVVVCVAGLHHIVELEHLISQVAHSLASDGEFWSISEYVGRNGARLWNPSYAEANRVFARLEAKYRLNHITGKLDGSLSNADCSEATFEGIRAEEVEQVLREHLVPRQIDRWGTIGWRVVGPAYVDNYDMEDPVDVAIVEEIAGRDVELFLSGALPPVAMRGVFTGK